MRSAYLSQPSCGQGGVCLCVLFIYMCGQFVFLPNVSYSVHVTHICAV